MASDDTVAGRTWIGFAGLSIGLFMAILDMQIVATSLPTIRTALGIDADAMSWVQTAYIAAEVCSIPVSGLLTRALGMRGLFLGSVLLFTAASAGCAASGGFHALLAWRIAQGLAAGALIPLVFSAVFLLFPPRLEAAATSIAGGIAVLAPTVGPIVGGWITHAASWRWLFLINVAPGLGAALLGWLFLARDRLRPRLLRELDGIGLLLLATALAALVIGLKEAPDGGWASRVTLGLFALSAVAGWLFVRRSRRIARPLANLSILADRRAAVGSVLNFAFGVGLFGSTYLLPVFLALVRGHNSLSIGRIMLVTGVAQLVAAPVAVVLEKRSDPRWLSLFGFLLFGAGLALGAMATRATDAPALVLSQAIRGAAIMFCLLPATRLALGHWPPAEVPDASALFNTARNLGGAIGIALVDTVLYGRGPHWAGWIATRLQACDVKVAAAVGLPLDDFRDACGQPVDADTRALVAPLVRKLALTHAVDEAWAMLALITAAAALALWWVRRRTWKGPT